MVYKKKPKSQMKTNKDSNIEDQETDKLLDSKTKTDEEIQAEIKETIENGDYVKVEEPKEATEEDLLKEFANKIKSAKPKANISKIKITSIEERKGNIYVGVSESNLTEQQKDAIASLLWQELEIRHTKKDFVDIKKA